MCHDVENTLFLQKNKNHTPSLQRAESLTDREGITTTTAGHPGPPASSPPPASTTTAENPPAPLRRRYQMPLALVGLLSSLALWDAFRFYCDQWGLDQYPLVRMSLVPLAQCVTAINLLHSNVQMAIFSALAVGYAVVIFHASFRKLTPAKQPARGR